LKHPKLPLPNNSWQTSTHHIINNCIQIMIMRVSSKALMRV
jgi:hypothetical protein